MKRWASQWRARRRVIYGQRSSCEGLSHISLSASGGGVCGHDDPFCRLYFIRRDGMKVTRTHEENKILYNKLLYTNIDIQVYLLFLCHFQQSYCYHYYYHIEYSIEIYMNFFFFFNFEFHSIALTLVLIRCYVPTQATTRVCDTEDNGFRTFIHVYQPRISDVEQCSVQTQLPCATCTANGQVGLPDNLFRFWMARECL